MRTSQRSQSKKSYAEADENGSDIVDEDDLIPNRNTYVEGMVEVHQKPPANDHTEVVGDGIEKILDHREAIRRKESTSGEEGEDEEEETVMEYFVKWKDWANIHNTYPQAFKVKYGISFDLS